MNHNYIRSEKQILFLWKRNVNSLLGAVLLTACSNLATSLFVYVMLNKNINTCIDIYKTIYIKVKRMLTQHSFVNLV